VLIQGTITGITLCVNGNAVGTIATSLSVPELQAAIAQDETGDNTAREYALIAFNWTYDGTDAAEIAVGDNMLTGRKQESNSASLFVKRR